MYYFFIYFMPSLHMLTKLEWNKKPNIEITQNHTDQSRAESIGTATTFWQNLSIMNEWILYLSSCINTIKVEYMEKYTGKVTRENTLERLPGKIYWKGYQRKYTGYQASSAYQAGPCLRQINLKTFLHFIQDYRQKNELRICRMYSNGYNELGRTHTRTYQYLPAGIPA